MFKLWLLVLFFPFFLYAQCGDTNFTLEEDPDKVEVYATQMHTENEIVYASDDIVVLYKDYYLSAKDAKYDKKSGNLELFGNVRAVQGDKYQVLGDYARLNISQKEREFKPFYMLEQKSQLWMSADKGVIQDKLIGVSTGMVSGCDPIKPLWKIKFSSSEYDSSTKWMNLYNAKLYIYDIPIFYTPYFGYSLDTTRRSGLLIPAFGVSSDEGFYYRQPVYIAVDNWWDLELDPQLRTSRGYGSYQTFRFVDSKVSKGSFTTGYFKETNSYVNNVQLAHSSHYGVDLKYENSDFLNNWFGFDLSGQSGLYVDGKWMNDVDYINLANSDTINNTTSNQLLSQVNMFYNTPRNYFGAYFKYYQDLSQANNEQTLERLPTLQYHNYLSTLFSNHIMYDMDFTSVNLSRETGKNAVKSIANIPVTFQTSLFDEYLNLSYQSQFYAEHIAFNGSAALGTQQNNYENGLFLRQYNIFDLNTNLTKAYDDFTHTMIMGVEYTRAGSDTNYGFYKSAPIECSINPSSDICQFYTLNTVPESTSLDFSQYLYNKKGDQFLYHRLSQQITYSSGVEHFGNIENELDYKLTREISLYDDTFYDYDKQLVAKTLNSVSYNDGSMNFSLSYLYKDSFLDPTSTTPRYTKYLTSNAGYRYNDHYKYFAGYNYDVEAGRKKSSEIGFLYSKRCWDFGLRYVENTRSILTQDNLASSVDDRYIFFTITLKPIGGSEVNYRVPGPIKGQ
jgi:LPS-assembly protein